MRKSILVIVFALFFITGCTNRRTLLEDHKDVVNSSLKAFYELNRQKYVGDAFEVKVLDVVEVPYAYSKDTDIKFYRFRIVIAPKYEVSTQLTSIRLDLVNDDIMKYLNGSSPIGTGNIDVWNSVSEKLTFERWEKLEDFNAYELSITFNNLTDLFMSDQGITDDELRQALQHPKLTIKYNDSTDRIRLDDIEIVEVTSGLQSSRENLLELSNNGQTFDQFIIYE